jgi:hypothetical protein
MFFLCLLARSHLFTGQLSCFDALLLSFSHSLCTLVQSYIRWSTGWFPPSQGHSGDSSMGVYVILFMFRAIVHSVWTRKIAIEIFQPIAFQQNELLRFKPIALHYRRSSWRNLIAFRRAVKVLTVFEHQNINLCQLGPCTWLWRCAVAVNSVK